MNIQPHIYIYTHKKLVRQGRPMLLPYPLGCDHNRNITTLKLRPHITDFDELDKQSPSGFEPMPSSMLAQTLVTRPPACWYFIS